MATTSNIGFGGLNTTGKGPATLGSTLFGVDVGKLVDGLVQARGVPNTLRQDRIDANTAKLSAYSTFTDLLTKLKTAAAALRNPSVASGVKDAFDAKQTLSRASGAIPASDLYGVSASDTAAIGSYSLTINRIAKMDSISGTATVADRDTTPVLATGGTLVLNGKNVTLTNTMTLAGLAGAINDKKGETGVQASIVQAGTNDFRLVLKGTETGKAISLSDDQGGALTTALGLAPSGATNTSLSAEVVLDGVTLTRPTNSVNDLISGVNIELYQADPGKAISLKVDSNLSGITDSVSTFLGAYNDVVAFVKAQRAVGAEGAVGKDQVLFKEPLLQSTYRRLQSLIGGGASGVAAGALKTLEDVGISLDSTGKLNVSNSTKFEDNLLSKFEQVRDLFGFADRASSGLNIVDRPDTVPATLVGKNVTVRVTATDGTGKPTAAEFEMDGVTTAATVEGGFVRGAKGTAYEGLVVGYTGGEVVPGSPYTGTFTLSQGMADQVAASVDDLLNADNGSLKLATNQLKDANTKLEEQNTALTSQLDLYRTRLTLQFQAAQNVIAALDSQKNSILSFMDSANGKN